jgi:AraC-like DNA-binding protein
VKFKANQNALVSSKADVELPFVLYNSDLLAIVAPQLEVESTQQPALKTFSEQAKGILKQLLAGQRPGRDDLARKLHLSARTLQWRLIEQEIAFHRLLEDVRRELAPHYLLHSSRELNDTAYLLGYEDTNSFFRIFHQWEGTSPGQRRVLRRKPQPTTTRKLARRDTSQTCAQNFRRRTIQRKGSSAACIANNHHRQLIGE